ncbi:MAG: hypothetical protein J6F30_06155 [Cellulosilyticum sp.]|nr:hypothetical protein [Cellulosilyticum sp.]
MLVGLLVGVIGFQFVLERMNFSNVKFVNSMQLKTRELKAKKVIQYASMLVIGGILWGLMARTPLGAIPQGAIVGVIWAIIMFIFEDTMFDNARNTLR